MLTTAHTAISILRTSAREARDVATRNREEAYKLDNRALELRSLAMAAEASALECDQAIAQLTAPSSAV